MPQDLSGGNLWIPIMMMTTQLTCPGLRSWGRSLHFCIRDGGSNQGLNTLARRWRCKARPSKSRLLVLKGAVPSYVQVDLGFVRFEGGISWAKTSGASVGFGMEGLGSKSESEARTISRTSTWGGKEGTFYWGVLGSVGAFYKFVQGPKNNAKALALSQGERAGSWGSSWTSERVCGGASTAPFCGCVRCPPSFSSQSSAFWLKRRNPYSGPWQQYSTEPSISHGALRTYTFLQKQREC